MVASSSRQPHRWEVYNNPANRFVASFVGANNFLTLDRSGGQTSISGHRVRLPQVDAIAPQRTVVAAIRPEAITVGSPANEDEDRIELPVAIRQVSFTGREMNVAAVLSSGEEIEAITKPSPDIIALQPGQKMLFSGLRVIPSSSVRALPGSACHDGYDRDRNHGRLPPETTGLLDQRDGICRCHIGNLFDPADFQRVLHQLLRRQDG